MIVADCPRTGRTLIDYPDLLALVNLEPGVIVMHWACPCGEEHLRATGAVASADPVRAAAAEEAVRRQLATATASETLLMPRPTEREAV